MVAAPWTVMACSFATCVVYTECSCDHQASGHYPGPHHGKEREKASRREVTGRGLEMGSNKARLVEVMELPR